jgi:hypothetical protein
MTLAILCALQKFASCNAGMANCHFGQDMPTKIFEGVIIVLKSKIPHHI